MSKFLNISTDTTLGGNSASNNTVSSQKAIKSYVDLQTGTASTWGNITGTLSNQTDLKNALDGKYDASNPNGYTSNVGTVTSVNNVSPVNGNVSLTIPTVNNATLTIQKNGTTVKTFTANASSNVTANITVPTKVSDLTNDSGFISGITSSDVTTALGYTPYNSTNPSGYQANVIETVKVNGVALTPSSKAVDVTVLDYYGTCDTAAATQVKAVTCAGFVLATGATVRVKFTNYQNYNGSFKLNVNSTGDIEVKRYGTTNSARYDFRAGQVVAFTYDGTYWLIEDTGLADTTYFGKTKLSESATSTSTNLALALKGLNSFSQNMISNAPVYSSSSTYAVGERVRYNYNTWVCKTAITTAESWTAAHWEALPDLQTQIDSISSSSDTVGTVKAFAGSTAPTGWLKCDGSAISRTTYSALFAVIGTTYGSGNGSTTFNVPNVKLQGGTISVLGNGKTLGMTDGTNNFGITGQIYMDGKISINTGAYNKNAGATGLATGTGPTAGVGYGVVTSGESGLTLGSTQTVNAIIKY